MTALGFNRLKFDENASFVVSNNAESPIGFSNRLVDMGPNAPIKGINSAINQFKIKYIANCD